MNEYLFHHAPKTILLCIADLEKDEKNIVTSTMIAKQTDITNSHVMELIRYFDEQELVTRKIKGRRKHIILTAKGKKAASLIRLVVHNEGMKR